jgi:hypothetical protein
MNENGRRPFLAGLLGAISAAPLVSQALQQSSSEAYVPKQSDRPELLNDDEAGFTPIFDGKTLDGWEGDPRYWRVEGGALVGEVTPETLLKSNTFVIWRAASPRDFELKADYRITTGGNSGINYRSVVVADAVTPANRFVMRGYQADIDGQNRYTGQNYEEKGRLFLATRGELTHVVAGRKPIVLASLGEPQDLAKFISTDWNSYHLIVRGNVLIHILNGHLMSVVIDDDEAHRSFEGLIGVQVHVGPPMKVEYRNFRLRKL